MLLHAQAGATNVMLYECTTKHKNGIYRFSFPLNKKSLKSTYVEVQLLFLVDQNLWGGIFHPVKVHKPHLKDLNDLIIK